jgi:two-component system, LuxR family, sensor kinase FixL
MEGADCCVASAWCKLKSMSADRNESHVLAEAPPAPPHHTWAWSAAIVAAAIFTVDTFTPLDTAIAVFYVIVIHLAAGAARRSILVKTSLGCAILTVFSYIVVHGDEEPGGPMVRCIISLCAIGITSGLALRNHTVEATLREQADLLDLTHDAIFVRDMRDTITYWNRGAEQLYGWPREEAIGRRATELLQTRFPAPQQDIRAAVLRHGVWEGELIHTTRSGGRVVAASRWALQRDKAGKPVGVLENNNDVTAATTAREELHLAQSALAHAARVATLGELSASIAHEVNQPLSAIITNGEAALRWMARKEPDLGEAQDALRRVISDGERASEVIRRIRALSRKNEPNRVRLDVNAVIEESLALVEREIAGHRVALDLNFAPGLPAVEADRIQLQQVLINLLLNALQAMDAVEPEQRRLRISSFADDAGQACIAIEDSGPGFDTEMAGKLFSAFFTTKASGMGMGLSICRSIVEANGGRIWATRNDGAGATFQVALPGLASDRQAPEGEAAA